MFDYSLNFNLPCQPCTAEVFEKLVTSAKVRRAIAKARECEAAIRSYSPHPTSPRGWESPHPTSPRGGEKNASSADGGGQGPDALFIKQLEAEKAKAKRNLPCIMFQATFDADGSGKRWRNNKNARLNGLFIVDIDHVENPMELWERISLPKNSPKGGGGPLPTSPRGGVKNASSADGGAGGNQTLPLGGYGGGLGGLQVELFDRLMLAFITASGHGLKLVLKADASIGDIAANQEWICKQLCIECDKACKDAARISYCPSKEDILFINSEIFEYNNEEYDRQYGGKYRGEDSPHSQNSPHSPHPTSPRGGVKNASSADGSAESSAGSNQTLPLGGEGGGLERDGGGLDALFHGIPYARVVEEYTKLYRKEDWTDGVPQAGERHQFVHRMARDLRYLCDMDKTMLVKMLHTSPVCRFIEGRDAKEFERIVDAALSYKTICGYPQSVRMACKNCGIDLPYFGAGEIADDQDEIDYDFWASRLLPLLHPDNPRDIYARAVAKMDDKLKLGGVLVAGAMTGTYLTQCYFQHYDARLYRLSYLVYVIGPPASGKSFLADLDKVLMYAMKQQDEIFRKTEKEYTERKERNEQLKGAKEKDIPAKPHLPIRYVPSTISNKVLYNRLTDAVTSDSPDAMHLHLFTTETELATALRVQVGSWAGKLDLELNANFSSVCTIN